MHLSKPWAEIFIAIERSEKSQFEIPLIPALNKYYSFINVWSCFPVYFCAGCYLVNPAYHWKGLMHSKHFVNWNKLAKFPIKYRNNLFSHTFLLPETAECKISKRGIEYQGTLSLTKSGRTCQRWDTQTPHSHSHTQSYTYPDGSVSGAANYCRNPSNDPLGPWCLTLDPAREKEYCDVLYCAKCEREYNSYFY